MLDWMIIVRSELIHRAVADAIAEGSGLADAPDGR